jgi:ABC-type multidrug transport system ATPase subunit
VEQLIHAGLRVQMEGRTTLIIAHRLSTISLADRVVLLDQHKIVADGTHAELLASTPLYAEVLAQAAEYETAAERDMEESEDGSGTDPTADAAAFGALLDAARSEGAR